MMKVAELLESSRCFFGYSFAMALLPIDLILYKKEGIQVIYSRLKSQNEFSMA